MQVTSAERSEKSETRQWSSGGEEVYAPESASISDVVATSVIAVTVFDESGKRPEQA